MRQLANDISQQPALAVCHRGNFLIGHTMCLQYSDIKGIITPPQECGYRNGSFMFKMRKTSWRKIETNMSGYWDLD